MATGTMINLRISAKQTRMIEALRSKMVEDWPKAIQPPTLSDAVRTAIHEAHASMVGTEAHEALMAEEDNE